MRAIQVTEFGGPEVLVETDLPDPQPADGMVLLETGAAGINYADTHQTENSYLAAAELPMIPGAEVVGTTPEGRRVVALVGSGGYAERVLAAPLFMYDVPEGVDDGQALAIILQGTTAWHLLRTCAHLQEGESVVVHAAAGGVGTLAIQLAKRWGAGRVIAAASSEDKRQLALDLGADVAIDARRPRHEGRHRGGERRARSTWCSRWSVAPPSTAACTRWRRSGGSCSSAWQGGSVPLPWTRRSSCRRAVR